MANKQINYILEELKEHLHYTVFSVAFGLIVVGILSFIYILSNANNFQQAAESLFHVFHPLHMLFSATATTAMFLRN